MGDYSFILDCPCCANELLRSVGGDRAEWKRDANSERGHPVGCSSCGCTYTTEDDGVPADQGGGIRAKDISQPQATSINPPHGDVTGRRIRVNGHSFATDTPVVLFDGEPGLNCVVVNDGALDIDAPPHSVRMLVEMVAHPYATISGVSGGPFTVGETVTGGTSGATAEVRTQTATHLMLKALAGVLEVGETLTGSSSGATATADALSGIAFQGGETVQGATSGATVRVATVNPLRVDNPNDLDLVPGEEVVGLTSGARALLGDPWYDGHVHVVVENAFGRHEAYSVLPSAFEYTV
ncbi:MAG TPA: hypothetical protein VM013_09225 [Dehalococcoidia bacterium]|nr:hypothetical protein [Thermoleophilia bacterium]HUS83419.1 hypothetical protein [Dehalococcoidia bacterium]